MDFSGCFSGGLGKTQDVRLMFGKIIRCLFARTKDKVYIYIYIKHYARSLIAFQVWPNRQQLFFSQTQMQKS